MKQILASGLGLWSLVAISGCETTGLGTRYDQPAYAPKNPNNVRVKVSLNRRMVYVMEGDKPLLATATSIGRPDHPTPQGNFRVFNKITDKRSGSYGYYIRGNQVIAGERQHPLPGSGWNYTGFPMAYWVEFSPGYGFHEGSVWPIPRTHGCLRLHKNDVADFYALVKIGTPVNIASTQPEDKTLGANFKRPQDYANPDRPTSVIISPSYFYGIKKAELINQ